MSGWPAQLLDDDQRLAWLRLIRSENVGPTLFYQLIDRFGSAQAALQALPEMVSRGGKKKRPRICPADEAAREMERLEELGARLVARGEKGYPPLLAYAQAPPPLLCLRGQPAVSQLPPVAMVGARNASAAGRHMAREMAAALTREGYVVVSGLAAGIDAAAHEGALNGGATVAVLACGIDVPYPRSNEALMERIAEHGLLLTEMPPGTGPRAELFPRRNRLVAGMSLGTVVVEAARRSGSLITARLAAEEGRHVMAVPGSPLEPRAAGCNHLIREGATLVRHAADVLELLAEAAAQLKVIMNEHPPPPFTERGREDAAATAPPREIASVPATTAPPAPSSAAATEEPPEKLHKKLLSLLGDAPVDQDTLLRECGAPPDLTLAALMELELAGKVVRTPDGRLERRR